MVLIHGDDFLKPNSNHPDVVITIVLIITVLFGIFVYYLIEIPLLRHTKKIFFFNKKSKNILK